MVDVEMDVRQPNSIVTSEIDLFTVKTVLSIPEFQVKSSIFRLFKPKPQNAKVSTKFEERFLEVNVEFKDFRYQWIIKQLPGAIVDCKEEYAKGKITLILTKEVEESWVASLASGLETA